MIEMVFSMSLIAVVIMFVFNLFPLSSVAGHRAHQQIQASALAQASLERTRPLTLSSLPVGTLVLPSVSVEGITYTPIRVVYAVSGCDPGHLVGIRIGR